MKCRYKTIPCCQMTSNEVDACSRLFSENYGIWSQAADEKLRGKRVKLSPDRLREMFVSRPNRHVTMMFDGDSLVGHVFYIRADSPWSHSRKITFVQQLVLDKKYRGRRFGLKMLQSVFGLSSDDAWGLYTSNPLTIRALEDATFRRISINGIQRKLPGLKSVLSDAFEDVRWLDSFRNGCVDTGFKVDHGDIGRKVAKAYPDGSFPFSEPLREGEEYLAMVFRGQPVDPQSAVLGILTETSREVLADAYSKMDMESQKWASHAKEEVDELFAKGWIKPGDKVLDLGCGMGRHSFELAKRGCSVRGVDFSERLIEKARSRGKDEGNPVFEVADITSLNFRDAFDVVLCLYDVIGSSVKQGVDSDIAKVIRMALKKDGLAIVSVMNLERTRRFCRKSENLFHDMQTREDFLKLVKLPASTNMQKTGEVFKGPLLLLNPDTGVAYRKEQFIVESDLPREYVIVDKRYAADDLCRLFRGFDVMDIRYVRAGRWNECLPSDAPHAKEVFGVFRKRGHALIPFADVLHRFSERATRKVSNRGCAAQLNLK